MKIVIPVAGAGTRLRPHTITQPKVLLNVAGHPMIYYIVSQLIKKKIGDEIIFITGYQGEKIEKYIKSSFKGTFRFVEQKETLGLGHAVLCSKVRFDSLKNEEMLIILGDTLFDVDLKRMLKSRYSLIGVKKVDDPKRFGVVEKNKNGFITRFVEKPASKAISKSDEAIVGLYFIKDSNLLFSSLEHIVKTKTTTKGEFQLTDALEIMVKKGDKIKTYYVDGWLDCGKPETILETNRYLLNKNGGRYKFKNSYIIDPVYIGKNVKIENSVIGPYATINSGVIVKNSIIENSIIDSNCHIENTVLSESLIGKYSKVINKKGNYNLGEYSEA